MSDSKKIHYYFVDEAGDLTLFDRRGRNMVGKQGVSNYFFVGVANIKDPHKANEDLERLRKDLLNDCVFRLKPAIDSG